MSELSHSLYNDFPQYRERIQQLKHSNEEFARMAAEYHRIDHSIRGLETRGVPTSNDSFEQMKRRRVQLKDALFQMLQ
ncbi:YdcH family protein [Marinobacterium arenosum]|uniref:YdcH family protein n=1 Tax=Marinobacterium arenosum TaxID=2862496 RepID=UPI001C93EA23|nr:DUF465 domain-containing protein [Marinobacterium arenosum]MBY4675609.1 DUF465 domain-containing protein [Marinobacterium arenosum]